MARLPQVLVAALVLTWALVPGLALADETIIIYEYKTPATTLAEENIVIYEYKAPAAPAVREAPKAPEPAPATGAESVIANSSYSIGLQGGYGIEIGRPPNLDLVEVQPSVAFPITDVVGSSFYRGVLEYKIEPFFGLVVNRNDRGEAGLCPIGFRYNFTRPGGMVAPYFEGLLGVVYLNVPKDVQSTRFNFVENAGAGLRLFVSDRVALGFSARFRHTSNAGIRRPNHGFNTGFLLLGLEYY